MKLEILELAQFEIDDSKDYYNLQQNGLGDSFKSDVRKAIDKICISPELYPIIDNPIRRSLLHRFPFSVIYAIQSDIIVIISIAHHRRKPYYWVERIDEI